jgi:AraC-like DNA-binding protein
VVSRQVQLPASESRLDPKPLQSIVRFSARVSTYETVAARRRLIFERPTTLRRCAKQIDGYRVAGMTPFETPLIPEEIWRRLAFYDRTIRVVEYLEGAHTVPVTLERVAREAGMERTAFSRFFHGHVGVRFSEFLRAFRVARAIREIKNRNRSVTELAYALGFGCVETFERDFRRATGMAPSKFRGQLRTELDHGSTLVGRSSTAVGNGLSRVRRPRTRKVPSNGQARRDGA